MRGSAKSLGVAVIVLSWFGAGCAGEGNEAEAGTDRPSESARLELDSEFPIALGNVSSVRELPGGVVLVADPTAPAFLRMDFEAGALDTLGREGDGPEEYRQPDRVLALAGDSTLVVDLGRLRFMLVTPEETFAGVVPMTFEGAGSRPSVIHARALDSDGGIYYQGNRVGENAPPDSVAVVRFDRASATHDTVGNVWLPEMVWDNDAGGRRIVRTMLNPADGWTAGDDGTVAIVRANGYSVEWVHPDGSRVAGPSHPVDQYPVGQADKDREMLTFEEQALVTMITTGAGGNEMSMRRGIPPGGGLSADDFTWAEVLPVFDPGSILIDPDGRLWVTRRSPAGEGSSIDVFDRRGERVQQVGVPPDRTLLGFGSASDVVYLARRDEFGLRWVERYRVVTTDG